MFDLDVMRQKRRVKAAKKKITSHFTDGWPDAARYGQRSHCIKCDSWHTMWPFATARETSVCKYFSNTGCVCKDCSGYAASQKYVYELGRLQSALNEEELGWADYVCKTSLGQKIQDWKEFKELKRQIEDAYSLLKTQRKNLQYTFDEDDDSEAVNACIKRRIYMYEKRYDKKGKVINYVPCYTRPTHCTEFAPMDDEQLCPHTNCVAYGANKKYYDVRMWIKRLEKQRDNFWQNKIEALREKVR